MIEEPGLDERPESKPIDALIHNLNNALAPATLLTDLLLATEISEEKRLGMLRQIQKSLAQAKTIIGEIEDQIASKK
ncbi:MAG: hypothetical protein IH996_06770 [Proteobacteria bacterium]|nr:hypothetical protein [Pseudomonadota bacterium]